MLESARTGLSQLTRNHSSIFRGFLRTVPISKLAMLAIPLSPNYPRFRSLAVNRGQEADHFTPHHNPLPSNSSRRQPTSPCPHKKGAYTPRHWERDRIHIALIRAHCYKCSILVWLTVVNPLLCWTDQMELYLRYAHIGKNMVYIGVGTMPGFRHPLGVLGHISLGWVWKSANAINQMAVSVCLTANVDAYSCLYI